MDRTAAAKDAAENARVGRAARLLIVDRGGLGLVLSGGQGKAIFFGRGSVVESVLVLVSDGSMKPFSGGAAEEISE